MFRRTIVAMVMMLAAAGTLSAQGSSPLAGTWVQNVPKSKYSPADLASKSSRTRIDVTPTGVTVKNDGVDSQGRKVQLEYTATLDGKDHPVKETIDGKPSPNRDAVAWKKIDDYTYEAVYKLKGQTVTVNRNVVSKDGKTRTVFVTGKNLQGQAVNNVLVWEKQ